jgi:hypothetical protein
MSSQRRVLIRLKSGTNYEFEYTAAAGDRHIGDDLTKNTENGVFLIQTAERVYAFPWTSVESVELWDDSSPLPLKNAINDARLIAG